MNYIYLMQIGEEEVVDNIKEEDVLRIELII